MIELSGGDWFGQEVNEPGTGTSTYVGQEYTPIGPGVIHWTLKEPPCNGQFWLFVQHFSHSFSLWVNTVFTTDHLRRKNITCDTKISL